MVECVQKLRKGKAEVQGVRDLSSDSLMDKVLPVSTLPAAQFCFFKLQDNCFTILCWFLLHNNVAAAAAAKSLQLCPTLCDPIDCSPPGSPVPGILQTRMLEWVAISFSNA